MLQDKELKCKKKEIDKIEAEWSRAQKDLIRAKVTMSDAHADILAREQSKNKLLSQCIENGRKFSYNAPVSSETDVHLMFTKIQKLPEQDKLSLMRKEVKFKKLVFSELPPDFVLFKQYNITAAQMYQNLLTLHAVDPVNQETISVEDIYEVTDILASLPSLSASTKTRRKSKPKQVSGEPLADLEWPPLEDEFVITLDEQGWNVSSIVSFTEATNSVKAQHLEPIKTRAKDDVGKTYWVYADDESTDVYEEKHVLAIRPSISLAKNIKRKDPVFALLNREDIEAFAKDLFK